jgi:DNA (cytosine-5)-methyltransferase 1
VRYLSICSGIEAATVAWHPLGWQAQAFAEIEPFPSAVLAHHYPSVPNLGDVTRFQDWPDAAFDVLVGGTPCQSFSVAGLRAGLDDPRGSLMLVYLAMARRFRPRWVVWENVPGVLSSDDGRAFGSLLGGLAELGYGFAYRVLDAQYFNLAQQRARVFVVGYLGDWRRAAAVLFERASLSGHPAPSRDARQAAPTLPSRGTAGGGFGTDFDLNADGVTLIPSTGETAHCLNAGGMGRIDYETETLIAHSLRADGFDGSEDGTGRGTPLVALTAPTLDQRAGRSGANSVATSGGLVPIQCNGTNVGIDLPSLRRGDGGLTSGVPAIAFDTTQITHPENRSNPQPDGPSPSLAKGAHPPAVAFLHCNKGRPAGRQSSHTEMVTVETDTVPTLATDGHQTSAITFDWQSGGDSRWLEPKETAHLQREQVPAVAYQESQSGFRTGESHPTLDSNNGSRRHHGVMSGMQVRRLTPRECERLQGFPDDYTLIPYRGKSAKDGPRYKALGNSFAVPVVRWIGQRIQMVEDLCSSAPIVK